MCPRQVQERGQEQAHQCPRPGQGDLQAAVQREEQVGPRQVAPQRVPPQQQGEEVYDRLTWGGAGW